MEDAEQQVQDLVAEAQDRLDYAWYDVATTRTALTRLEQAVMAATDLVAPSRAGLNLARARAALGDALAALKLADGLVKLARPDVCVKNLTGT